MERLALNNLLEWKDDKYRKPLLLWGARQTGKTYLLKDIFAQRYYKDNHIYIDCRTDYEFVDYCESHTNANNVLRYLSYRHNIEINENTLLIFDEAQECLPIITLMKYFCQDYREVPVIVTGSMVRIKIKRENNKRGQQSKGFLFPTGKINELTLFPMSFEEFLINTNEKLYNYIKDCYKSKIALEKEYHNMALDYLYNFLFVGGMPEAVQRYIETQDLLQTQKVIKELYNNYLNDMELYQASAESIVRSRKIYENLYNQLNKKSKNFKASLIEDKKRNRDLRSPIDWLTLAYVVYKSSVTKDKVSVPISEWDESLFRLYMADTGLFVYQSGIKAVDFITDDGRKNLPGILFENYIADEIIAKGLKLFYWKGKNDAEFEFIFNDGEYIIPVDVKKGRGTLNSLEKFKNHNKFKYAIKISSNNYGYDKQKQIYTIPLYAAFLVLNDLTILENH